MKKVPSKKKNQFQIGVLTFISVLLFMIILLLTNFFIVYYSEFKSSLKLDNELSKNVFLFLEGKEALSDVFSEREVSHLNDVKNLIMRTKNFFIIIILIEIALFLFMKHLRRFDIKIFTTNSLYSLFFIAFAITILILFLKRNFYLAFSIFHSFFFEPKTWIFEGDDLIVNLFPEYYFESLGLKIFEYLLLEFIFIIILLFMIKSFNSKRKSI